VKAQTHLVAWSCTTSLGESAGESSRLLRAGLSALAPSRFVDARGRPIATCVVPAVAEIADPTERLAALAAHSLEDLAVRWDARAGSAPVLVMALGERFAEEAPRFELTSAGKSVIAALPEFLPAHWRDATIEPFPFGRAGGAAALRRAVALADTGQRVVWGGCDSWHDWTLIESLARGDRLLGEDNIDGLLPGEGSAFVALGTGDSPGRSAIGVVSIGVGREPAPIGSQPPWHADGLVAALNAAAAPLREQKRRCNSWWLDTGHEAYAIQELQNVIARLGDVVGALSSMAMPFKQLGDVGAAAMPVLTVLAAEAWVQGHGVDDVALISCSSDGGARGAVLLSGDHQRRATIEEALA
jgi:hypothetical protein